MSRFFNYIQIISEIIFFILKKNIHINFVCIQYKLYIYMCNLYNMYFHVTAVFSRTLVKSWKGSSAARK